MADTVQVNTRLNVELVERLKRLSALTGRSNSHYVAEFVERGLNDLEDHYLMKDALEAFYASDDEPVDIADVDWEHLGR